MGSGFSFLLTTVTTIAMNETLWQIKRNLKYKDWSAIHGTTGKENWGDLRPARGHGQAQTTVPLGCLGTDVFL